MSSKLWAITRYTLLEHLRGRMLGSTLLVLTLTAALESLLGSLSISETHLMQASLAGALERAAMVLLLASGVIVSQVREAGDKSRDWLLAFPLQRWTWLFGRLGGHLLLAVLLGLLAVLPLLPVLGLPAGALWSAALCMELSVCACMACFLSLSLPQAPVALLAFAAWYLLARGMAALLLIADMPMLDDGTVGLPLMRGVLHALSFLLPRLDLFAPASWLEGSAAAGLLLPLLLQSACYGAVLVGACLIDLWRSEW